MKRWIAASLPAAALALAGCVTVSGDDPTLRTPRQLLDDGKIERQAKRRIAADEKLAGGRVNVASYDGIVLLTGQVAHPSQRDGAERALGGIPYVRKIHNEIQVGGAGSEGNANDGWLTAKVFSKFAADKAVDAGRIKVVTDDGVVYLLGVLPRAHADAAAEAARTVQGVRKVVKLFDYL